MNARMNFKPRSRRFEILWFDVLLYASMAVLLFTLLTMFAGCAGANIKESINTGVRTADVYTKQTTELLQADAISSAEAQSRQDIITQAKVGLRAAVAAAKDCSNEVTTPTACNNAKVAYDAANALLNSTLSWLIAHGKTGK